jgi:hypothetical protein
MQAEQCSCQLQNANFFCRTCLVGGSTEFKQGEDGYGSLFKVSRFALRIKLVASVNLFAARRKAHAIANPGAGECVA